MRILPFGLALFILVPILEIYLIITVGGHIGPPLTILLIIGTAVIGIALLRMQGLATMQRFQQQMQQGELPAVTMLEGMLLFLAGALLLTPGFFTDSIGFMLLIPPIRKAIALWGIERSGWLVQMRGAGIYHHQAEDSPRTIEGDFKRKDD